MTYTPNRITKKDLETEEISIDGASIQRNLDLIAKETKNLQNQIIGVESARTATTRKLQLQTSFVNPFLFGGF